MSSCLVYALYCLNFGQAIFNLAHLGINIPIKGVVQKLRDAKERGSSFEFSTQCIMKDPPTLNTENNYGPAMHNLFYLYCDQFTIKMYTKLQNYEYSRYNRCGLLSKGETF